MPERPQPVCLSVMVPARNEEDVLGECLRSLLDQPGFVVGRDWELIVIDDHSTDRTREIAASFEEVTVIDPTPLANSWTGKANALWTAANQARGDWLLFTDADTIHKPGDLERAVGEAEAAGLAMLSYSAEQLVTGFWQHVMMPLIFAELTRTYPWRKVGDPASPIAAANGQFLLVRRDAYFAVGGHRAVSGSLLEDVDLARLLKSAGYRIRLRYAEDAVATRMYRDNRQMIEGWTKNLARLFPRSLRMAAEYSLEPTALAALPFVVWKTFPRWPAWLAAGLWGAGFAGIYRRSRKSNFPRLDCALSPLGMPLFAYLLAASWFGQNVRKQVAWKGRTYSPGKKEAARPAAHP